MTTFLITGAGRGIGHEMARQALAAGHDVIATVRPGREAMLADLAGPRLAVVPMEASDPASVAALEGRLEGRAVDVLIVNAGVIGQRNASSLDHGLDWQVFADTLAVNTIAPLFTVRAALPALRRASGSRVLVISSGMGSMSYAKSDTTFYRASKAAVNKVVQTLATDLQPLGIAAIAVHPGWVRTDMGGPGADIAPETSAADILALAGRLDLAMSGGFFNHDGAARPF